MRKIVVKLMALAGFTLACSQSSALMLDSWNDSDLNASGDYIDVTFGTAGGNTWFSVEWMAGANNGLDALGIDKIFYNCENCSTTQHKGDDSNTFGGITAVYLGATAGIGGTDVSSDWVFNFGGEQGGGGFGSFSSRQTSEASGDNGVGNILTFLLNGIVTFTPNSNGAQFDVHVRYDDDCSGWASDGNGDESSSGECAIPEPAPLILLGLGFGLLGLSHWAYTLRRT